MHEAVARARAARDDAPPPGRAARDDDDDGGGGGDEVVNPWRGHKPAPRGWEQLHLSAGDVVIAHQKLPHRVSPNRSPHIRYQAYYRVSHADHRPDAAPLPTLWEGFDVVGDVAGGEARGVDRMVCDDAAG